MNFEHWIFSRIIRRQLLRQILIEEEPKDESADALGHEQISKHKECSCDQFDKSSQSE